jgi:hypothetical protein
VSLAGLCLYLLKKASGGEQMRPLWRIADFVRAVRRQMQFGKLTRAPIRLLRLEWRGEVAECDWMARPADKWDAGLARHVSDEHVSLQALQDAIDVRELLFAALPDVETASLRVFRQSVTGTLDSIIVGTVTREQEVPRDIPSVAMRAKLLGFQFWFEGETLESLQSEECGVNV